ncbi:MAG: hypothetical protein ACT4OX_02690 [Actinomycetota bacterium]
MEFRRPKHPERVAIVAVALLVAANLAFWGLRATNTSTAADDRPDAIEDLFPSEGAVAGPREVVGANLRDHLTGVLYIDGVRLPEDQYSGSPEVGEVLFRPGDDQDYQELPEGERVAIIEFWDRAKNEDDARAGREVFSYTWRFTVGF